MGLYVNSLGCGPAAIRKPNRFAAYKLVESGQRTCGPSANTADALFELPWQCGYDTGQPSPCDCSLRAGCSTRCGAVPIRRENFLYFKSRTRMIMGQISGGQTYFSTQLVGELAVVLRVAFAFSQVSPRARSARY